MKIEKTLIIQIRKSCQADDLVLITVESNFGYKKTIKASYCNKQEMLYDKATTESITSTLKAVFANQVKLPICYKVSFPQDIFVHGTIGLTHSNCLIAKKVDEREIKQFFLAINEVLGN